MALASSILTLVAGYLTIYAAYWLILGAVHISSARKSLAEPKPWTRFAVAIPAHNEELLLPSLLASVTEQDYPDDLFMIIVVADNCTDGTATVAKQFGAAVLERRDLSRRGKGYAIKWALDALELESYDALVIVDADSVMREDALRNLDRMIQEGSKIIQCYNGLGNPDESWFTRLLDVSRTIGNEIYHPAKQRLGLSSYLMGNGMCFTKEILQKYGWDAFTVGEDWEYYAKLLLSGETVSFAHQARVYHRESSSLKQATSQRMRWASGRFAIALKYGFSLLWAGLRERSIVKFDGALPLILPNPSLGMNITVVGLIASSMLASADGELLTTWFVCLVAIQVMIFLAGVCYCRNPLSRFMSIFVAPAFLIWKLIIDVASAAGMGRKEWVRTHRE